MFGDVKELFQNILQFSEVAKVCEIAKWSLFISAVCVQLFCDSFFFYYKA